MTATLVQSNTATNSTTVTSMTVTLPAGVTEGNLLVLLVGQGSNLGVIGPPSGWSVAYNKLGDGQPIGGAIFYRLVDAATAGQTSWTVTLSTKHTMTLAVQEWSAPNGWVAPDPLDQQTFQYVGSSTALDTGTSPALTNAPDLVVANLSYHTALQSLSGITAGYTLQSHVAAGTGVSLATLSRQETASGVTERCQATIGTATVQVSGLAAFSEAAPVGGGTTYDGAMAAVGGASGALAPTRILSPTTLTVTGSSASALAAQARLAGRVDATGQGNATLDPVVRGLQQAAMSAAGGAASALTGQARLSGLLVATGAGNADLKAAGSSLVVASAAAVAGAAAALAPTRLLAPPTMRVNGGGTADLVAEKRLVGLLTATAQGSATLTSQRLVRAAASAVAGGDARLAARLLLTALLDPATGGADAALLAERLGLANPTPVVLLATLLATLEATAALTPPLSATAALLTPLAATGSLQTDGPTATASLLTPSPTANAVLDG